MRVIEIERHKAVAWTYFEERLLRNIIKTYRHDLHRLHNTAFFSFPDRERQGVRRKAYRIRRELDYLDTVNHVKTELLGA